MGDYAKYYDDIIQIYIEYLPGLLSYCGTLVGRLIPIFMPLFGVKVLIWAARKGWSAIVDSDEPQGMQGTSEMAHFETDLDMERYLEEVVGGGLDVDMDAIEGDLSDLLQLLDGGDIDYDQFQRTRRKMIDEWDDEISEARGDG